MKALYLLLGKQCLVWIFALDIAFTIYQKQHNVHYCIFLLFWVYVYVYIVQLESLYSFDKFLNLTYFLLNFTWKKLKFKSSSFFLLFISCFQSSVPWINAVIDWGWGEAKEWLKNRNGGMVPRLESPELFSLVLLSIKCQESNLNEISKSNNIQWANLPCRLLNLWVYIWITLDMPYI